jgi:nicotinate phosphoribosyltransferase
MWLIEGTAGLWTDFYELTMAQVYFKQHMQATACFEVTVRHLPPDWGFFVMAGLNEVESYLRAFRFDQQDVAYLRSLGRFDEDFLSYLSTIAAEVQIRALPEGTVFFEGEPILEVSGPICCAQLLESYVLNILGFSIIEATLAARTMLAARGISVVEFGLRRCQGPVASIRAVRGARIAGFAATSNVFGARALGFPPSGTMAHSYVEVHDCEEDAFRHFAQQYGANSILLVDTYDPVEGIKTAAKVAKEALESNGVRLAGIRLDSGDLVTLSRFAREYFARQDVAFMKIFVSGDLDEYQIHDLLAAGAEMDGIGIGTRYSAARHSPAIEIVYKITRYDDKDLAKTSPNKHTRPGRKSIRRLASAGRYERDLVAPFEPGDSDLLQPFRSTESMQTIQERLRRELSALPENVKSLRNPAAYPVQFVPRGRI